MAATVWRFMIKGLKSYLIGFYCIYQVMKMKWSWRVKRSLASTATRICFSLQTTWHNQDDGDEPTALAMADST
jgi:hypothetical protein